ncbi:ubiquitin carboxyl-terminal hydrolase 2 [Fusarium longipes]|uniref:ubiquitinyl hydrolase 1 n=1 Tax=Fusarium longipes TaxID=694270 RepID=A0A395T5J6_9HYPO|nr:ubiquitin carboxyl-terminal hydrolase 2 [Fusarium longipes]
MADQDNDTYGTLPGTDLPNISRNQTQFKDRIYSSGWEGCNPSRWIYELLNNNFTKCDLFERARRLDLDLPFSWQNHTHRLIINGNQSYVTPETRILSSKDHVEELCNPRQAQWPPRDGRFPWHHLVWAGSESEANIANERSKYYPLLAREHFACSADPCTFSVTLEVSMPRMPLWWINLLLDSDAIREELRIAKENDPDRYMAATDDWAMQAPLNLNTYLKNLIEATSQEGARSISKRNKRFAVLFGPRCFRIFQELEFEETIDIREDGVDEGAFKPVVPPPPDAPSNSTRIGTYRGYVEDVRAEVQCLIHKRGEPAELCTPSLHAYLGCSEIPDISSSPFVNLDRYRLMGVLPSQAKEIVDNAYRRQWDLMPTKRRELIEALGQIANDLNDEHFSHYAVMQSSVFESQIPTQSSDEDADLTNQALIFFGLQPPNNYNADSIVLAFRRKVAHDPSAGTFARNMLMVISNATNDETHKNMLMMEYVEGFSLPTAKEILGLSDASFDSDTLDNIRSKIQNAKDKDARTTYLDALNKIADHTNSTDLKSMVASLRNNNNLSSFFADNLDSPPLAADYDLPVGLENIGNTCYLNSLLQYLFTVKPVREIAVNYDDFKLDLTDEMIEGRLLGGNKMRMKREEAVVAQAFARELSELFNKLESSEMRATKPSQRLANAVLLDTDTLVKAANTAADAGAGSQPPPLPTRPPPGLPAKDSDDVEMATVVVKDDRDPADTASTASSQTLVEDSDRSYDKVEASSATNGDQITDTVMEVGQDDDVVEISRPNYQVDEVIEVSEEENHDAPNKDHSPDSEMIDAEEPQTIDQKVLTALEHQERSSGTDQQDVEEVMGNIISRLQAAIRPSSVDDATGIQMDAIMKTFFVTTINYTKRFDENVYQKEISFDRFITAFPSPQGGTCSLYDALGRNFDQQVIEGSQQSRYTAIKTLPPVLHVLIQRSQSVNGKNDNPVEIPETLYLDRYMDAPHDSATFRDREKSWATANRISEIKACLAAAESAGPTGPFLESFLQKGDADSSNTTTADDVTMVDCEEAVDESWDFDGPVDDDYLVVNRPSKRAAPAVEQPSMPKNIKETESTIRERMKFELRETTEDVEKYHAELRNSPYRLHAVICHRGSLSSGHYWVWIFDFEQNVWRKYNDSNVEVKHSTDEVLKTFSSGEPYFLCYVRDEDKEEYVGKSEKQSRLKSLLPLVYKDDDDNDDDEKMFRYHIRERPDVIEGWLLNNDSSLEEGLLQDVQHFQWLAEELPDLFQEWLRHDRLPWRGLCKFLDRDKPDKGHGSIAEVLPDLFKKLLDQDCLDPRRLCEFPDKDKPDKDHGSVGEDAQMAEMMMLENMLGMTMAASMSGTKPSKVAKEPGKQVPPSCSPS